MRLEVHKYRGQTMRIDEAKILLGLPPDSCSTLPQIKAAYKKKAWESHPDRFPPHQKLPAESNFKLISEAYSFMQSGAQCNGSAYARVVRTGTPKVYGGRSNSPLIKVPFLLIIASTLTLGVLNASRAYQRQKDAYPSHNPFLP
ncbi:hypothetical protein Scep_008762 [Stephania cephalantha]|uniref:J domain-containing protein n=1 Tax=Stephania cephalantha TaxID=152367 RepID=A0AAP0JSD5_9MAGN